MSEIGIQEVIIASGASLSGEVDLDGYLIVGVQMPAAWTAANLTFQAADKKGGTYQDVFDSAGTEVSVTAAVSRYIGLLATPADSLSACRHIKIRSGTTGLPVAQAAARTILLFLKR